MKFLALDSETALISPETLTPHLICVTWFNGQESGILHWKESREWLTEAIKNADKDNPLVLHNAPYDLAVFVNQFPELEQEVFKLLDRGGVRDTIIREKLIAISRGQNKMYGKSLKDLAKRYFEIELDKTEWRTGYERFKEVPLNEWPDGAKNYAIMDAIVTGKLYLAQMAAGPDVLYDEINQTRADYALHLCSVRGIITNPESVAELERVIAKEEEAVVQELKEAGLINEKGKRNNKLAQQIVLEAYGDNAPRTEKGNIMTGAQACKDSDNPILIKSARYRQLQTLKTKDLAVLKAGTEHPIRTRYDVLLETGRTSSSKPNLQNPARAAGVRECFVPRPGFYFCSVDYNSAELHTLAQVCYTILGKSRLRDILNEGKDPHLMFAAELAHITYEEAIERKKDPEIKGLRQLSKAANFGLPGGMAPRTFVEYAHGYGIEISEQEATSLRNNWFRLFPEMRDYFNYINSVVRSNAPLEHLFSGRIRGDVKFTQACNSLFQGLAADAAKSALYEVTKACKNPDSPLFGSHPILFIHDQIIAEVPINTCQIAAKEMARIMIEEFNRWTPDVSVKAEPCLMKYWSKEAECEYDTAGNIIVYE